MWSDDIDADKVPSTVLHKFPHILIYIQWSTKHARDQCNKNFINSFSLLLNQHISNISNLYNPGINLSLESQTICYHMFSYPKSYHIFFIFLVKYLIYILFLLVCGNFPLTSKTVRCWNLL